MSNSDYQFLSPGKHPVSTKVKNTLRCWVCEGWKEKEFVWTEGKSGNLAGEPMYIHFEFDNWRPWLMARNLENG